eukprot:jgi/Orpsp1_1/1178238/evm.model.c7180000064537.1
MLMKSFVKLFSYSLLVSFALAGKQDACKGISNATKCVTNSEGEITELCKNFDFEKYTQLTKLKIDVGDYNRRKIYTEIKLKAPKSLKKLTLNSINLTQDNINTLSSLTNIEKLYLEIRSLEELNYDPLKKLSKLTVLDIKPGYGTDIDLPESIYSLTKLKTLKVPSIKGISSKIGNLKKLQELDLNGSEIYEIPDKFMNLVNLTKLNLNFCNISKIPKFFGNFKKLTELDLRFNQITELPDEFKNLSNLTILQLSSNGFKKFPRSIANLKNLSKLEFNINKISKISDELNLTNLTELSFLGNQLTSIPKSLGNSKKLTSLILYHNKLSSLPNELKTLVNLTELKLNENKFTKFPSVIQYLKDLEVLDLSVNEIDDELPQYLNNLTHLKTIDLNRNKNIKGQMLTNKSLEYCYFDEKYDLCLVEEAKCLDGKVFKKCGKSGKATKTVKTTTTTITKTKTSSTSKPTNVSTDGRCGSKYGNTVCPSGNCCSKYGYCGKTNDHCSTSRGCQSEFGKCI